MIPLGGGLRVQRRNLDCIYPMDDARPCTHRLTQWYEDGASAAELAPTLSVYLGHVSPRESYWYVSATPELLGSASDRFRVFAALGD
jgi:hypothetical protein